MFTYTLQVAVASSILNIFRSKAANILGTIAIRSVAFWEDAMKDGIDFCSERSK